MTDERTHGSHSAVDDDDGTSDGSLSVVVLNRQSAGQTAEAVGASYFDDDRGPIAGVGRNSIPKSHRGEGVNFVD